MAVEYKTICKLTDKKILGTDGLSCKPLYKKSRAILINKDYRIAVMYEKKSNFYALPGGGIEQGENEIAALVREVAEETGCVCDIIEPLGVVFENRYHADTTHLTYFFVVHTKTTQAELHLTDDEVALGTTLKWCSIDEAWKLIKNNSLDTYQKRFLQARDLAALNEYIHSRQNEQTLLKRQ